MSTAVEAQWRPRVECRFCGDRILIEDACLECGLCADDCTCKVSVPQASQR